MYYTGTENECNAYLAQVNTGENYQGTTTKWAEVLKHPTKEQCVIIAHYNYASELEVLNELPEDWLVDNELL